MATIMRHTRHGFNVTGLATGYPGVDFKELAVTIGAESIGYLDASTTALRGVWVPNTDEPAKQQVINNLFDVLKASGRYTTEQKVQIIYLEEDLVLVAFEDGLPHDFVLMPEKTTGIDRVAYGDRCAAFSRSAGIHSVHAWHRAMHDLMTRMVNYGMIAAGEAPFVAPPWKALEDYLGRIIMVDPGLVIVETSGGLKKVGTDFHRPLPVELIGNKYYVIGAYNQWPQTHAQGELTQERVRFLLEIGRVQAALGGGDFIEATEAPIVFDANF
jgi:hypothetical protein